MFNLHFKEEESGAVDSGDRRTKGRKRNYCCLSSFLLFCVAVFYCCSINADIEDEKNDTSDSADAALVSLSVRDFLLIFVTIATLCPSAKSTPIFRPTVKPTETKVEDTVVMGKYEQENSLTIVVKRSCSLRSWLNSVFLNDAFAAERIAIPEVIVKAENYQYSKTTHAIGNGTDTIDWVFFEIG